ELEVLRQRKLDVPGAGGADQALASRPRPNSHALVHRHQIEGSRVDVLNVTTSPCAASASLDHLLHDGVASNIVRAAMVGIRAALGNEDRAAAARREDPRDLPTSERVPQRGKPPIL